MRFPLPSELFPKLKPELALYYFGKLRRVLLQPVEDSPITHEWNHRMRDQDRHFLFHLAGVYDQPLDRRWEEIPPAVRAKVLAMFARLEKFCRAHADFTIGANEADYLREVLAERKRERTEHARRREREARAN